MQTTFKGQQVTRQDVLDAIREFVDLYPTPGSYDDWLLKDYYIYALRYGDSIYPPKHIWSRATGIPTTEFNGGEPTNRVFRQLGFEVGYK